MGFRRPSGRGVAHLVQGEGPSVDVDFELGLFHDRLSKEVFRTGPKMTISNRDPILKN